MNFDFTVVPEVCSLEHVLDQLILMIAVKFFMRIKVLVIMNWQP